jgi:DNA polymerase III alpha subunit (gram-positive type)
MESEDQLAKEFARAINNGTVFKGNNNINATNIIVLDLETDGTNYIIQCAYNIYDKNLNKIKTENILINENIGRTDYYNKISLEDIEKNGIEPKEFLDKLIKDLKTCNHIVGHNIDFDLKYIQSYCYKFRVSLHQLNKLDTMKSSNRLVDAKNKNGGRKMPKLCELYQFLFDKEMSDEAHTANYDVDITFECFKKLVEMEIILL